MVNTLVELKVIKPTGDSLTIRVRTQQLCRSACLQLPRAAWPSREGLGGAEARKASNWAWASAPFAPAYQPTLVCHCGLLQRSK